MQYVPRIPGKISTQHFILFLTLGCGEFRTSSLPSLSGRGQPFISLFSLEYLGWTGVNLEKCASKPAGGSGDLSCFPTVKWA